MFAPAHRPHLIPALLLGAALVFAGVRGVISQGHSTNATQAATAPAPASPAAPGERPIVIVTGNPNIGVRP